MGIKYFENDSVSCPKYSIQHKFVAVNISDNFHLCHFDVRLRVSCSEIPKFLKFDIQRNVHRDIFLKRNQRDILFLKFICS